VDITLASHLEVSPCESRRKSTTLQNSSRGFVGYDTV